MDSICIDESSTKREMLFFLTGLSKNHVVAICMHVNRCAGFKLSLYGNKDQLISGLAAVDRDVIWTAIDSVVEDDEALEEEAEEGVSDEDDECQACHEEDDAEDEDDDDDEEEDD